MKSNRFEIDKDTSSVCVQSCGAEVLYGYDYQGLSPRAVITPQSERCTISFVHALTACMCGALVGAADAGKSTSVTEIGKLLGRFVLVFNCHQDLTMDLMENVLKGLPACGCFGCLDEMQRLTYPLLSACAQQLSQVLAGIRERRNSTAFGDSLKQRRLSSALDLRLGLFLTMSGPLDAAQGQGQGDRDRRVFETLGSLYRTIAIPDIDMSYIAKVKLAAGGFVQHDSLALKLKSVYKMCSVLLSGSKRVCSLGLRNLTSVIQVANKLLRESEGKREGGAAHSASSEADCLVQAMRGVLLPRMSAAEKTTFNALVGDVFVGVEGVPGSDGQQELADAITSELRKLKMDKHATCMEKLLQLHAVMLFSHGVLVVGGAMLGKSSMISTLEHALQHLAPKDHHYSIHRMHPKSQSVLQMFGSRDALSDQWRDGTLSFLWRRALSQTDTSSWIVLDGPIDPLWAENLNTVLDDHKVLTLANSDRIAMNTSTRVIFETDKTDNVSPATMSRVGLIWIPSTALPWRSYVNQWIEGRGSEERVILRSLFDRYMDQLLYFSKMQCSPVIQTPTNYVACMLTRMFDCASKFMDFRWDASGEVFLEKIFIFCMCWSFGGLLENMDRIKLSQFMYTLTDVLPVMKGDATIFDFYPDDNVLDWEHWRVRIPEWKYPKEFDPTSLVVNTEDSCRTDFLLRLLSSQRLNILLTGPAAASKSHSLRQFLSSLDDDKYLSSTAVFSEEAVPASLLDAIFSVIDKRQGRTYGPESGKSCVIAIEDISLCPCDKWDDQVSCELLRQLIADGGYYDERKSAEWLSLMGLQYMAVMRHPLATHRDIPIRLKAQFCTLNMTLPSESSMSIAMTRVFDRHFTKCKAQPHVIRFAKMLPEATLALCKSLRQALATNDAVSRPHYTFNLHDAMRILKSILHCSPPEYATPEQVLLLWRHDCERVVGDKLVTQEHKQVVADNIRLILQHKSFDDVNRDVFEDEAQAQAHRFGSFLRQSPEESAEREQSSRYGMLADLDTMADSLETLQVQEKIPYPLYDEAIELILRVARVLSMPRGSVVLVGPLSSGRASISRLAAALAGSTCFYPDDMIMRGGGSHMDSIQEAHRLAGITATSTTLLLFADKMDHSDLMHKINHFLLTGCLPGAVAKKELDAIADDMRSSVLKNGTQSLLTDRQILATFEHRAWNNMHIVLCCSPDGHGPSQTMQRFPALASAAQTIWMLPWAGTTLNDIADIRLADFPVDLGIEGHQLSEYAAGVHSLIEHKVQEWSSTAKRPVHVTPRSYLAFIETFRQNCETQSKVLEDKKQRIQTALIKLRDAGYQVSEMKSDLLQKEQVLQEAHVSTAEFLKTISMRCLQHLHVTVLCLCRLRHIACWTSLKYCHGPARLTF